MKQLITADQKDAILHLLFDMVDTDREVLAVYTMFDKVVSFKQLEQILRHFERLGLIQIYHLYDIDIHVELRVEADRFVQRGGFTGQEEIFQKNVEKLLWEVEKLERIDGPQKNEVGEIRKKISEYLGIIASVGSIGDSAAGMMKF